VHVALASTLTVAFLVAGVAALRRLWGDRSPGVGKSLRTGICLAAAAIPLQFLAGDQHGLNTLEHQPAKIAAMEANWRTRDHVPLVLFAWPDAEARENRFELAVPDGASLILTHARSGVVPGLDQYVAPDGRVLHPPVRPLFLAFRVMVGVGVLMLVTSWTAAWQLWRRGEPGGWVLRALAAMTFSGWIATLAGWYVTEIGRQPWLVTGVLLTETAVAEHPAPVVGATLALYLAVYAALIVAFMATITYLARKAARLGRTPASPVGRLIETEPGR
jgi:cytochrome d ubiquinol oxidase subunit I